MRTSYLCLLLLLVGKPAYADDEDDPTAELLARSYRLAGLGDGRLVAASTYGITVYSPGAVLSVEQGEGGAENQAQPEGPFVAMADGAAGVLLPDSATDVAFHNGHLYAANGPHGVVVFQGGADGGLKEIARVETEGAAMSVVPHGALLFVASGVMGVEVFDISDPRTPGRLVTLDAGGYARHVLVVQDEATPPLLTVYVANGRAGIAGFRLKSGCKIDSTFFLKTDGEVRRVAAFGDGLLFSKGFGGVCLAGRDLRKISGQCIESRDAVRDIASVGSKVYLADGGGGLIVVDWADPEAPVLEQRVQPEAGSINGLLVVDDKLYLAADAYGLLEYVPAPASQ